MELSGWSRSSRGVPAQSTAAAGTYRIRMGSRGRGSTEWQGSGTRSRTGRFVPAGTGSNPPEHAHSLHSTTQGAHRSGSRLWTIPRGSVVGRPRKVKASKELVLHVLVLQRSHSRLLRPQLDRRVAPPQHAGPPRRQTLQEREI